jgi:hypothetical protein
VLYNDVKIVLDCRKGDEYIDLLSHA